MQLYIDTFGTSLHRKANAFEVFKKGEKTKLAPTKIKSIVLSKGAKISSDAVLLAIENEIDIVFVNGAGQPKSPKGMSTQIRIETLQRYLLRLFYLLRKECPHK